MYLAYDHASALVCKLCVTAKECVALLEGVQLKSGPYFNMSNLFTRIYMLYYTTNLYLQ